MIQRSHLSDAGEPMRDLTALLRRSVTLSALLAEKEIPLETLSAYSLGSVIVLGSVHRLSCRVMAGDQTIASGTAVEVNGRLAVRIDRAEDPRGFAARIVNDADTERGGDKSASLRVRDVEDPVGDGE